MSVGSAPMNVVLVHGAFVDGSTWRGVYDLLAQDGYRVAVVQNPTSSLQGDVAETRRVIDAQEGPVVLVGHSYGGAVITEAGSHDKVAALVYVAAFAPDEGESVKTLSGVIDAPDSPLLSCDGFLFQNPATFHDAFGADLSATDAAFMADSQLPWAIAAKDASITQAAWHHKPTWYLIATEDRMISPAEQRAMALRAGAATLEVTASHAVYMSKPTPVADLIRRACVGNCAVKGT
jgi:pimeloyl-ACP methyl ester carboxylesterase